MGKIPGFINLMGRFFELFAKATTQALLLNRHGYSYNFRRAGGIEWSWEQTLEKVAEEKEIKHTASHLKGFSERNLNDLGISRSGIEAAVRYGHSENDFEPEQKKSVA